MTLTRRPVEDRDIQRAIVSFRTACHENGWTLMKIEPRLFRIYDADNLPFYTVRIVRRADPKQSGIYYDIGDTLIAKAKVAVTKIIQRIPR